METLYQCCNTSCSLGSTTEPGHFTGGMSAQGKHVLTGTPVESLEEGRDFGEGVCPNCGTLCESVGEHTSVEGNDPYVHYHAQATNQDEFLELVANHEA